MPNRAIYSEAKYHEVDDEELKRLGKLHAVYKHTEKKLAKAIGDAREEKALKLELKEDTHKLLKCISRENVGWLEASLTQVQQIWASVQPATKPASATPAYSSVLSAKCLSAQPSGLSVDNGQEPSRPTSAGVKCNHAQPTWEQHA